MLKTKVATFRLITMVVLSTTLLAGCANMSRPEWLGTGAGAVVGAVAGYAIGAAVGAKDGGKIGLATGLLTGALIGNRIAKYLDERDRQTASTATQQALNTPIQTDPSGNPTKKMVTWASDHNPGVRGQTTIVKVDYDSAGKECRDANEVAYVGGKEISENVTYCREPGRAGWARVA